MPKSARRRTDNVVSIAPLEPRGGDTIQLHVSGGEIARRAFEIYCERGWEDGHDVDHWLAAERELRGDAATINAA